MTNNKLENNGHVVILCTPMAIYNSLNVEYVEEVSSTQNIRWWDFTNDTSILGIADMIQVYPMNKMIVHFVSRKNGFNGINDCNDSVDNCDTRIDKQSNEIN